jgi:hypothetical protein
MVENFDRPHLLGNKSTYRMHLKALHGINLSHTRFPETTKSVEQVCCAIQNFAHACCNAGNLYEDEIWNLLPDIYSGTTIDKVVGTCAAYLDDKPKGRSPQLSPNPSSNQKPKQPIPSTHRFTAHPLPDP